MIGEKRSGIAWYYFVELHSPLTNSLLTQLAVNFKCHKNRGAIQLRKDALEITRAVKNIDCCSLFLAVKTVVQLLETLTGCVRYVCTLQECVPLESIRTLPSSVLYVIKNTFTHCKVGLC